MQVTHLAGSSMEKSQLGLGMPGSALSPSPAAPAQQQGDELRFFFKRFFPIRDPPTAS